MIFKSFKKQIYGENKQAKLITRGAAYSDTRDILENQLGKVMSGQAVLAQFRIFRSILLDSTDSFIEIQPV